MTMTCGLMLTLGFSHQNLLPMLNFQYFFRAVDLEGRLLGASVRSVSSEDEARDVAFDYARCMYDHYYCDVKVIFQPCRAPFFTSSIYFPPF